MPQRTVLLGKRAAFGVLRTTLATPDPLGLNSRTPYLLFRRASGAFEPGQPLPRFVPKSGNSL